MLDHAPRRPVLGVIGQGGTVSARIAALAWEVGTLGCEAGFRIACGGLGGVMEAVCRGAHASPHHREGTTLGFLPGTDPAAANRWVDIAVPTGVGLARNLILLTASDIVVAIAGGAGTLGEIALGWQLGKPIIGLAGSGGWAERLAGAAVDDRPRPEIELARTPADAIRMAIARVNHA